MNLIEAIVLGAVQGLTEFLPISSSGHLLIGHWLFGSLGQNDLSFDVALHVGTVIAVIAYFARDFVTLTRAFVQAVISRSFANPDARIALWIIIGTIPAAIIGLLLEEAAETVFRDPRLVAVNLIIVGCVFILAERLGKQDRNERSLSLVDALIIGFAQAIALVPGVSRSGITLSAGLFRGLKRESAARYSFLLATPITLAVVLVDMTKLVRSGFPMEQAPNFAAGIITSGIVGFLCIAFLLQFLKNNSLVWFAGYRFILGAIVLIVSLFKPI